MAVMPAYSSMASLFPSQGFSLVEYKVGIFNGDGINTTAQKDDKAGLVLIPASRQTIDGQCRLLCRQLHGLPPVGEDRFGGGGACAQQGHGGEPSDDGRLLVRSEYVYGNTAGLRSEGVYAVLAYAVTPKWQPLLSYDYFRKIKMPMLMTKFIR